MPRILTLVLLLLAVILGSVPEIRAQTTEFTFQGSLRDNATPANGNYDFEFALFDAVSAGSQIGATIPKNNVVVSNGIFSVKLDFNSVFPGANRFLEIRVRLTGQPGITTLAPRQLVNSAPYSVKSLSADNAGSATNAGQLGGVAANQYVLTTDPRMNDPRVPIAGSGNYIQNQNVGPQSSGNFNIDGIGTANMFSAGTQFNLGSSRVLKAGGRFGDSNTFVGIDTGTAMTTGSNNVFVGVEAGKQTTTQCCNTFMGAFSGVNNIVGQHNTYVGQGVGENATGSFNSIVGSSAGFFLTTGAQNSFFGVSAGQNTSDGGDNSFFGRGSGSGTTSGGFNSFFGRGSGSNNSVGINNTAIGASANFGANNLSFATALGSGASVSTSNTVVIGRPADAVQIPGALSITGALTTGGTLTGNIVTAATQYNIGESRVLSTPGLNNIFVGSSAGLAGANNSMFGDGAGRATTGNNNSFFGFAAGDDNVGGAGNSFFGGGAGSGNVSGFSNSFFGINAGNANIDGNDNTAIGTNADVGAGNLTNATAIGANALVSQSNSLVLGSINGVNGATTNTRVGIGTTAPERLLHVRGTGAQEIMIESSDVGATKWTLQSSGAAQNGRFEIIDRTGNSSKMTILPTGEVGIGTTGPTSLLTIGSPEATVNSGRVGIYNSAGFNLLLRETTNDVEGFIGLNSGNGVFVGSASNHQLQFRTNNTARMSISTAGLVSITNLGIADTTATLCRNTSNQIATCNVSSLRYKTNVTSFTSGLELIKRFRPISFTWKQGGARDIGFAAEEIAEIEPLFTFTNDKGEVEGVKYDRMSAAFVNAFKEQQEQIEELQKQNSDQKEVIARQQVLLEGLKQVVCLQNMTAELCRNH